MTLAALADRVCAGDRRAIARALSLVDGEGGEAGPLIAALHPHGGRATIVGVTGPPGAGKSTLVDQLTSVWRVRGRRVGVIAVDPSSPFTGGALLGDRVRMQRHALDPGVFVRSMATRGHLGGLSRAAGDAALVLDAGGFDVVVLETVGVGQDEVEIARTADLTIVVLVPGLGDHVQALKAGLMEIADVFVVNKADREGTDRAVAAVDAMLSLVVPDPDRPRPPLVQTIASSGEGIDALVAAIEATLAGTAPRLAARRRARDAAQVRRLVMARLIAALEQDRLRPGEFEDLITDVGARRLDPHAAADLIASRVLHRR